MEPEVLSKSEFASLIGVSPGRVSQYISGKKLSGEALAGEGRSQRIRVRAALAQLKVRLDIDQRLSANGINTNLDRPASASAATMFEGATPGDPPQFQSAADRIEDQIKTERLESLRRQNRKLAEEEAARAGRYVIASDAEQQLGRALALQMNWFEGALGELAAAVCSQFSLSNRDVVHCLRSALRDARERATASLQAKAEAMPKLVEDETLDDDDDAQLAD
jgi:hypothetical protein